MSELVSPFEQTPAGELMQQRRHAAQRPQKPKGEAGTLQRMARLVWPQRRTMSAGVLLGMGVALTYAASLGGLLPVLKVIIEQQSMQAWLLEKATRHPGWYSPLLTWLAGFFPNAVHPEARMQTLLILLSVLLGINLLGNALRCASQFLVLTASNRIIMDLRRHMFRKALHVPMNVISRDLSGTVSQFMSDNREVYLGIVTLFGKVLREPLKAVCVLGVAIAIDWRLTVVVVAIAPPAVLLLWVFGRKVRKATVRLLQGYGVMLSGLEESLQGIDTVKGYARQRTERRRMWQLERRMFAQQQKLAWIEAISSPLIEVIGIIAASVGIVWLASRTFSGEISTSQFSTMVLLLVAMLDPIRKVASVYNMVQRSGAAAARIFEFLDQPEERSAPAAQAMERLGPPAITFRNVTFRYSPDAPAALDAVNLTVRPGECVAIVGPNGSGKSTLMRLLPRLLEPQDGEIVIDGVEVRDLGLRSLREHIAIVAQRPAIFARTARENIAYGDESAGLDQVREAARRAFAAEFIETWPRKYETVLGEFGANISGGQRQRIAIARAFLKPSTILIFDEATSEIDAESERKIHEALTELRKGRTTFLIAHRHTVMDLAERIVVMDGGRVVDVGTHAELSQRCPLYVALYRSPMPH
ncbi:MAG: ABC transporter ATP-binding protein [Phycisphaerales bacterium]|nr:ABC transporter ATP-binding protein [Phycisphaerales bacterium]